MVWVAKRTVDDLPRLGIADGWHNEALLRLSYEFDRAMQRLHLCVQMSKRRSNAGNLTRCAFNVISDAIHVQV